MLKKSENVSMDGNSSATSLKWWNQGKKVWDAEYIQEPILKNKSPQASGVTASLCWCFIIHKNCPTKTQTQHNMER